MNENTTTTENATPPLDAGARECAALGFDPQP